MKLAALRAALRQSGWRVPMSMVGPIRQWYDTGRRRGGRAASDPRRSRKARRSR